MVVLPQGRVDSKALALAIIKARAQLTAKKREQALGEIIMDLFDRLNEVEDLMATRCPNGEPEVLSHES